MKGILFALLLLKMAALELHVQETANVLMDHTRQGEVYSICLADSTLDKNGCSGAACPRNSQCIDGPHSYECKCLPGFTGEDCVAISTLQARETRMRREENSDLKINCSTVNCSDHGSCLRTEDGDFVCSCFEDYTGPLCSTKLIVNGCDSINCSTNSVCKSDMLGCVCDPEFTGDLCETPIACLKLNCSENAACLQKNSTLEYFCQCDFGYNGEQCTEVAPTAYTDVTYEYNTIIYEYTSTESMITTVLSPEEVNNLVGILGGGTAAVVLIVFLVIVFTTLCKSKGKGN